MSARFQIKFNWMCGEEKKNDLRNIEWREIFMTGVQQKHGYARRYV